MMQRQLLPSGAQLGGRWEVLEHPQPLQGRSYNSPKFDEFLFCEWGGGVGETCLESRDVCFGHHASVNKMYYNIEPARL